MMTFPNFWKNLLSCFRKRKSLSVQLGLFLFPPPQDSSFEKEVFPFSQQVAQTSPPHAWVRVPLPGPDGCLCFASEAVPSRADNNLLSFTIPSPSPPAHCFHVVGQPLPPFGTFLRVCLPPLLHRARPPLRLLPFSGQSYILRQDTAAFEPLATPFLPLLPNLFS